jgi:sporulation-control protein spo0M
MHTGKHLEVNPATEERHLTGLTKSEVEELLDWIENNGFHLREVEFQETTGFAVRWDVR